MTSRSDKSTDCALKLTLSHGGKESLRFPIDPVAESKTLGDASPIPRDVMSARKSLIGAMTPMKGET